MIVYLQVLKFHGSECLLFDGCCEENDDEEGCSDRSKHDRDDAQNTSGTSWLELEGPVSRSPPPSHKMAPVRSRSSSQFEADIRLNLCDLLHYVDDLEMQVTLHLISAPRISH
jgi:hypothetical protein